jgi:hypothetical protein
MMVELPSARPIGGCTTFDRILDARFSLLVSRYSILDNGLETQISNIVSLMMDKEG